MLYLQENQLGQERANENGQPKALDKVPPTLLRTG